MRSLLLVAAVALLALLTAPALAVARGSGTYNGDLLRSFGINQSFAQEAMSKFDPVSASTHSPRLSLTSSNSECCDCVHSIGKHILTEGMNAVTAACANVTCPFIKQRCDWIAEHKEEFSGVLAVELRPLTDGYMFCMGNGMCAHPMPKDDISRAVFEQDSPSLVLSQLSHAAPLLEQVMNTEVEEQKSLADVIQSTYHRFARRHRPMASKKPAPAGEQQDDAAVTTADHHKKRSCHSCLRHSVRWVLKQSVKHLIAVCHATKCPKVQAFCKWAKEHKEFVRGMLYAHVQPWKMATGWCAGVGSCHCSKHESGIAADQSPATAPFNMGEREKEDDLAWDEEPKQPMPPMPTPIPQDAKPAIMPTPDPMPPVVIGGGDHDLRRKHHDHASRRKNLH